MSARLKIGMLSTSAALLVAIAVQEGYSDRPITPVKGDRLTIGFGSTVKENGLPIVESDTTNPIQSLQRTLAHIQKDEAGLKKCITAPLYQEEFSILQDFAYNYGIKALCNSSMVRLANAGDYVGSCRAYLQYRFVAGYDCSTPGNKRCPGVWTRSKERAEKCLALQ